VSTTGIISETQNVDIISNKLNTNSTGTEIVKISQKENGGNNNDTSTTTTTKTAAATVAIMTLMMRRTAIRAARATSMMMMMMRMTTTTAAATTTTTTQFSSFIKVFNNYKASYRQALQKKSTENKRCKQTLKGT
jgi:hypothetical protein